MSKPTSILGAAIGDCVHVAGIVNVLRLADDEGYRTEFLGPATSVSELIGAAIEMDPDIIAVSYRLTPESARLVLHELKEAAVAAGLGDKRFVFGGTEPVCRIAEEAGLFEAVFSQRSGPDRVIAWLRGESLDPTPASEGRTLIERITKKYPYPILRHHYGRPSIAETLAGIERIAAAGVIDVISLGTDQNAQESFFRPDEMDPNEHGSGGVPVRTPDDLRALYAAAQRGNYPLMRCYSGTRDLLQWAEMLHETIHNAWCAVPLTWYSVLDGRGPRSLLDTIREAQLVMGWHGEHGVPVEMNESHHWSLRDAPDTVAVAMALLAAYNARHSGVRDYVIQMMFNTPPGTSFSMDLAKMLAKLELIEELEGAGFRTWRETRTGLSSYPIDLDMAKGQLASSTLLQMSLKPHIVHVVSFSEADHAATADDVIESAKITHQVIRNSLHGLPDMTRDPAVEARKRELVDEARLLLAAIRELADPGTSDPWADPGTLNRAVEVGLIDAPHLRQNPTARGEVETRLIDGACRAVDPDTKKPIDEATRIRLLKERYARIG